MRPTNGPSNHPGFGGPAHAHRIALAAVLVTACGDSDEDVLRSAPTEAAPELEQPAGQDATGSRTSLVLVTVDTTRADHIGAYGYAGARTPTIDGLAAHGVRFDRAYSTVPLTTPSHSTILTGLYPTRHGVRSNGDAILSDQVETLAERLSARGWATGASVAAFVTTRAWNLDQGFDAYMDEVRAGKQRQNRWMRERPADEVVDDAIGWLQDAKGAGRPYFLWVHVYDPHKPYDPPPEAAAWAPGRPYDGEIAWVDAQLARLLPVAEASAPDKLAWIVVADHGEALTSEHGEVDHGLFLYDPTMRVPFIVRPPAPLEAPRVVTGTTVSLADVTPTALGLLGEPVPTGLDGVDLGPLLGGGTLDRNPVYMECYSVQQRFGYHPELAAAQGSLKLMDTPSPRLYDLAADPGEQKNALADHAADAARLREAIAMAASATPAGSSGDVAPEMVEQLAALGYVSVGTIDPAARTGFDAKDRLDTIRAIELARELVRTPGGEAKAEARYRELLRKEPGIAEARIGLGHVLGRQGRHQEVEELYREALEREPESTVLRMNLAMSMAAQKKYGTALLEMEAVLARVPTDNQARVGTLRMLSALGRDREALDRANAWLAEDPDPSIQAQTAMIYSRLDELDRAEPLLVASLADSVPRVGVHAMLARVATKNGQSETAAAHLRIELANFPMDRDSRWALANILMDQQRWDEAAAEYRYLAEGWPDDAGARRAWAQAVFNSGDVEMSSEVLAPALVAAPDDAQVLLLHANILYSQGDTKQAEQIFAEAKRLHDAQPRRP